MDSVVALYRDLKSEWDKQAPNLRKCGSLLDQLKVCQIVSHWIDGEIVNFSLICLFHCSLNLNQVALTKLIFLPTGDTPVTKNELLIARDVLEIAVQYSVATKDVTAFERYMAQLKCYYFDYK